MALKHFFNVTHKDSCRSRQKILFYRVRYCYNWTNFRHRFQLAIQDKLLKTCITICGWSYQNIASNKAIFFDVCFMHESNSIFFVLFWNKKTHLRTQWFWKCKTKCACHRHQQNNINTISQAKYCLYMTKTLVRFLHRWISNNPDDILPMYKVACDCEVPCGTCYLLTDFKLLFL